MLLLLVVIIIIIIIIIVVIIDIFMLSSHYGLEFMCLCVVAATKVLLFQHLEMCLVMESDMEARCVCS